jgi:hypothetical protein
MRSVLSVGHKRRVGDVSVPASYVIIHAFESRARRPLKWLYFLEFPRYVTDHVGVAVILTICLHEVPSSKLDQSTSWIL